MILAYLFSLWLVSIRLPLGLGNSLRPETVAPSARWCVERVLFDSDVRSTAASALLVARFWIRAVTAAVEAALDLRCVLRLTSRVDVDKKPDVIKLAVSFISLPSIRTFGLELILIPTTLMLACFSAIRDCSSIFFSISLILWFSSSVSLLCSTF